MIVCIFFYSKRLTVIPHRLCDFVPDESDNICFENRFVKMNEDEQYVVYGNALPSLDEDEASTKKLKPVPISEQIATDDHGRRRFHGAFTGGFSAGFFNTAGSRDGWAPKQFKSSRENRRQQDQDAQRPEDFMDDEDMSDFGFAPQKLQAAAKFRKEAENSSRKRKLNDETIIPGDPVLDQLIRPAQESIGVQLLKEMGWKPGQGIGPKLTRNRKRQTMKSTKRLFGPSISKRKEDSEEEDDDLEQYKDFLFAPDDIPNFVAKPKENLFGIGYQGLERSNVLGHVNLFAGSSKSTTDAPGLKFDSADKMNKGRKMKIRGQAFGVGAYEEDDEDIYQRDDMSRYDYSLDVNNSGSEIKAAVKKKQSRWGQNVIECLEGFVLSQKSSSILRKKFEPPEIPAGFQPKGIRKSRFEAEKLTSTNPTPNERRLAISTHEEMQIPKVEATHSESQIRAFLAENFKANENSGGGGENFKPFAKDSGKQKRYEQYLICLQNNRGGSETLRILQPKNMPNWERDREKIEFERAALLYKPLNFNMSSRFVSAGSSEDADKNSAKAQKELNESEKAVKMKLYGNLTRETINWHPAKLLCIRFNVKQPYGDASLIGTAPGQKSKFDIFGNIQAKNEEPPPPPPEEEEVIQKQEEITKENEVENEEIKEEKAPLSLFQSIFLASSSDSESEPEEEEETEKAPLISEKKPQEKTNNLRNLQPARGIFANVDFEKLNSKPDKNLHEVVKSQEKKRMSALDCFQAEEPEVVSSSTFGPAKPASILNKEASSSARRKNSSSSSDSDSDEWIEKSHRKSSKKSKKKHKKHKSKKSKKKSKKRKRKSSDSSDSSK